jgi:anthranilate/para-aminobenzoate synthase component II
VPPAVFYNDQINLRELRELIETKTFDSIVISPGPGTPQRSQDVGREDRQVG